MDVARQAETTTQDGTAQVVARLRRQIAELQAQPRKLLLALRTGVPELDEWGVFRLGAGVELSGEEASGRTSLALSVVAAAGREHRLAAWVDGPQELYPPAALALGVELERLLIVRPKAPGQLVWSAVQLLRSGAFACVVLDVTHTGVRLSLTETKKLLDAARAGGSLLVLLTSLTAQAQGLVRLELKAAEAQPARVLRLIPHIPSPPSGDPAERPRSRQAEWGSQRSAETGGRERTGDEADLASTPTLLHAGREGAISLSAPHGRHLHLARARLAPHAPTRARLRDKPDAAPWVPRVAWAPPLERPRKNLARDGYGVGGFYLTTTRLPVPQRGPRQHRRRGG
ncbi:MAG: hypothetical protein AB1730_09415 [Myxococcota bacterium]|jgi:hypothetical protein